MRSQGSDEEYTNDQQQQCKRRPLYTVRQPPLIQPLRLSAFAERTCCRFSIPSDDLAHEWVVLFQAISDREKMGGGMPLQIPDTILLSPSGQPSVWYTTSSAGRVKAKDLMRVSPQAILDSFQTPSFHRRISCAGADGAVAVQRIGFEAVTLLSQQLKVLCKDMELPTICLPTESDLNPARSRVSKGVFCVQRHIPCQNNASFLVVWRHLPVVPSNEDRENCQKSTHRAAGGSGTEPIHKNTGSKRSTPRAHSDLFLIPQVAVDIEHVANDIIEDGTTPCGSETNQAQLQRVCQLDHLDIERSDNSTLKILRRGGFDAGVMTPLLFYMKRVTSEIANSINLGHNTRQACGLACEFFVAEHNRSVYFSALRGIQWVTGAPSWETLREVDPLSRSLCEFYERSDPSIIHLDGRHRGRRNATSPIRPQSPLAAMYYELNPRFPSVHTPFAGDKQWLHRSQLLAPDISPRYVGASVPKIYRDGVFQSLLTAHQADSVVRLNLSPQAPASLAEVRREQPHLSPRSISIRRRTTKSVTVPSTDNVEASASSPSSRAV